MDADRRARTALSGRHDAIGSAARTHTTREEGRPRDRLLRCPQHARTCPAKICDKVIHYYKEPHPYYNHDVAVIGAKNSAAIAALELCWTGARVTLIHRGAGISDTVKYWIKPNIENRIKNGEIKAYFNANRRDPAGFRPPLDARGRGQAQERFRLRDDRLSARLEFWPLMASSSSPRRSGLAPTPRRWKASAKESIWRE